jgi:hypothetical protein
MHPSVNVSEVRLFVQGEWPPPVVSELSAQNNGRQRKSSIAFSSYRISSLRPFERYAVVCSTTHWLGGYGDHGTPTPPVQASGGTTASGLRRQPDHADEPEQRGCVGKGRRRSARAGLMRGSGRMATPGRLPCVGVTPHQNIRCRLTATFGERGGQVWYHKIWCLMHSGHVSWGERRWRATTAHYRPGG